MDSTPLSKIVTKFKNRISSVIGRTYHEKYQNEISFYKHIFKDDLVQKTNSAWEKIEKLASKKIKEKTGYSNLIEYIVGNIKKKKNIRILSLGSGACGLEINSISPRLQKNSLSAEFTCVDINRQILNNAQKEAKKRNIDLKILVDDINVIDLKPNHYDVIIAHASLHHFLKLDHITQEINRSLKSDGFFVTVDIPTKNGYLMWPETYKIVKNIWEILPDKFKIDYTKHATPCFAKKYENVNYSKDSFECINSEAILPNLRKNLTEKYFVPEFSISRRFFDTKFGPNYNFNHQLDQTIFNFITTLDDYYLDNQILKPETFFGVYTKKI